MLNRLQDLKKLIKDGDSKTLVVPCAHDLHCLEAVLKAKDEGLFDCILIGDVALIKDYIKQLNSDETKITFIAEKDEVLAAKKAVSLVKEGKASFILKGLLQTASLLKEVVNKETGIGKGMMSHCALLELENYNRLLGVSDGGMIPHPDLEAKKEIIKNASYLFKALGYEKINVAALCASENVSPKILESVEAKELKEMSLKGDLGEVYVEGPISLDLALDMESSKIKGYESPVCGETDLLLFPSMAAANIMVKSLQQFAKAQMAGVILGAQCPIALTSRSASFEEKYYSLLLACVVGGYHG